MTQDQEQSILKCHSMGFSNRKIARTLKINHKTVGSLLKDKQIKPNGLKSVSANFISESTVKCSKCESVKYVSEFQLCRKGKPGEYRLSYCNGCRKNQLLENLNSDGNKILKDMFNRLKSRSLKNNVPFRMSFDYFKEIYLKQEEKCFYSNEKMDLIRGKGINPNTCTVDKVIPEKGYVVGNIVFCTKRFNTIKSDLSLLAIAMHMPYWYDKLMKTEWLYLKGVF